MTEPSYLPALLNPFEPGFFDDPYAQYKRVRDSDPIHLTPLGSWGLFRYDDIQRVLRDPNLSVEERHATTRLPPPPEIQALVEGRRERGTHAMLNLDPPDHHRLRRLVAKVFTPRMVDGLRPRVRELVAEALDAAAPRGAMDLIADLAFPLPFVVISEMMGIPEGRDRNDLRDWSSAIVKTFDPLITPQEAAAAIHAGDSMYAYMQEVIAYKRAHPADDLLSALIAAEEEGDRLSEDELNDQTTLLFIAGHETTVNLIGNGMRSLLLHPDQLALLHRRPELIANAVDELLRYDGPVQFTRRITIEDAQLDGRRIPAGTFVMCCLGSGNHDPEVFGPTADALDITRPDASQLLSFGGGFHHCLGAALARVEGQEAIGALAARFPGLAHTADRWEWNGRIVIRGLERLPVALR